MPRNTLLLSVVRIANATRGWYGRGAAVQRVERGRRTVAADGVGR